MTDKIKMKFRKTDWYIILLVVLLVLPTIYLVFVEGDFRNWFKKIAHVILTVSLSGLFLGFFYRRLKLYFYLLFQFYIIAPLYLFYVYLDRIPLKYSALAVVFETDYQEASEFISGFGPILVVLVVLYILCYFLLIKKLPKKIIPLKAGFISGLSALTIVVVYLYNPSNMSHSEKFVHRLQTSYPAGIITGIYNLYQDYRILNHQNQEFASFSFKARERTTPKDREIYVLIVGESGRYYNWSLNGYSRQTSPRLDSLQNLFSFSDLAAGATQTRRSLSIILTRATAQNLKIAVQEKSFISAFNDAGFQTLWISNQRPFSITDTYTTLHAREATHSVFLRNSVTEDKYDFIDDHDLLPVLEKQLQKMNGSKIFIVLHSIGSHYNYIRRYKEKFAVFRPTSGNIRINDYSKKNEIVNAYDNSILNTDDFIYSVIEMIKAQKALSFVLYLSDHGEDLFDDDRKMFMHSNPVTSKYVLHIPMFLWLSGSYIEHFHLKYKTVVSNLHKSICQDNIFYSLLDLADIDFEGFDDSMSFASPNVKIRKRFYITLEGEIADSDEIFH